jgi:hypothetical protein
MALLILWMFPPFVRRSKCPYALFTMLYFYDMEKPGEFGVPNRVLHDNGTELFRTRTAWTATAQLCEQSDPYSSWDSVIRSFPTHDFATNRIVSSGNRLLFGSCPVRILADKPYSLPPRHGGISFGFFVYLWLFSFITLFHILLVPFLSLYIWLYVLYASV